MDQEQGVIKPDRERDLFLSLFFLLRERPRDPLLDRDADRVFDLLRDTDRDRDRSFRLLSPLSFSLSLSLDLVSFTVLDRSREFDRDLDRLRSLSRSL